MLQHLYIKNYAFYKETHIDFLQGLTIREIRPNGNTRAFIHDTPVSLQLLREVSSLLLDMHGQHDNQVLLSADKQLDLLDEYADCRDELQQYQAQLKIVDSLSQQIAELEEKERTAKGQWEYLLDSE